MMKYARFLTTIAVAALLITSCSPAPTGDSKSAEPEPTESATLTSTPNATDVIAPVWSAPDPLTGDLAVQDGVAVSYYVTNERLGIVARDVAAGSELWRDAAFPGAQVTGIALTPDIVKNGDSSYVPYLRHDPGMPYPNLVIRELRSGNELPTNGQPLFSEMPRECADGNGVCMTGRLPDQPTEAMQSLRFDFGTGAILPTTSQAAEHRRTIGSGLYDKRVDNKQLLEYSPKDTTLWERPYSDVFASGYSSDAGWEWRDFNDNSILIGFGFTLAAVDQSYGIIDLSKGIVTALDAATGKTLWKMEGTRFCDPMDDAPKDNAEKVIALCRVDSGTIMQKKEGIRDTGSVQDADVTYLSVELKTGKTVWERKVGNASSAAVYPLNGLTLVSGGGVRAVPLDDGVSYLDVSSGISGPVADNSVFLCKSWRQGLKINKYPDTPGSEAEYYNTGNYTFPCTSALKDTGSTTMSTEAIESISHQTQGVYVTANKDGMIAYKIPGE